MLSNVGSSNDKGLRNQYGISNASYIIGLCDNIYLDEDKRFWCFIDANYNLNVIELETMISEPNNQEYINYDLRTGEPLNDEQKIKITNDVVNAEDVQFKIKAWSPINRSGSTKLSAPTAIRHEFITKDYENNGYIETSIDNIISDQSTDNDIDIYSSFEDATTFKPVTNSLTEEFDNSNGQSIAYDLNKLGQRLYLNSMNIDVRLTTASYLLHIGKKIPVEIFNSPNGSDALNNDNETGNKFSIESQSNRNEQVINDMFSGWYSIIGMTWKYSGRNKEMYMSTLLTKRLWQKQYANKITE
jgi:hypothetical protein